MRAAYQQVGRLLRYCGALRASQPREKHSEGPVPPSITVVRLRTIDVGGDPWRVFLSAFVITTCLSFGTIFSLQ
jgi:hypothetical protein